MEKVERNEKLRLMNQQPNDPIPSPYQPGEIKEGKLDDVIKRYGGQAAILIVFSHQVPCQHELIGVPCPEKHKMEIHIKGVDQALVPKILKEVAVIQEKVNGKSNG